MIILLPFILSAALAAPTVDKRFIFSNFTVNSIFDLDTLKCDVQLILDVVGSDPTEQACEAECHKLVADGNVLDHSCPLVCHALQNLAHFFHETPQPGDVHAACGGAGPTTVGPVAGNKRFIFSNFTVNSIFDLDTLKCDVQLILDVVGSDPSEQACEAECHKLVSDGNVLEHSCPLVCHALQNLAHFFHETPQPGDVHAACGGAGPTTAGPVAGNKKRFIIGPLQVDSLFDLDALKCDVQIILDVVGSDPTEAACESECHKIINEGNILNHGCPLICHSVQNLAQFFHETPKPGDQHAACGGASLGTLLG